jgi:signal transduction histidine kinase
MLAERLSSSGMPVEMETTGSPGDLSPMLHLTVYRLAQESLTNAFKHADRTKGTRLHLVWTETALELRVRSSLVPAGEVAQEGTPSGRGIAGMKARAGAAGGWIETVRGEETFEVMAFLPLAGLGGQAGAAPVEPRLRPLEGVTL